MAEVRSSSVKLIFTSPPYWDLKDYSIKGQIGHKQSYLNYLADMLLVWKEAARVIKKDGVLAININDRVDKGQYYPIHIDFERQVRNLGFKYTAMAIWHKASGVPTSAGKLTDRFEYIILASKSKIVYENFHFNDYKNNKLGDINSWHIVKKAGSILAQHPHPAFFPAALVLRGIELFTRKNDLILDPFLGVANTMLAAFQSNRSCIGYEINPAYINTALETFSEKIKVKVVQ